MKLYINIDILSERVKRCYRSKREKTILYIYYDNELIMRIVIPKIYNIKIDDL